MRMSKLGAAATAITSIAVAVIPSALPAQAAGFLGNCYPEVSRSGHGGRGFGGGWCDGNGPDWTYVGYVHCNNGGNYSGPVRWAGDRRKSLGYCPDGTKELALYAGLRWFYKGTYRGERTVVP